MRWGRPFDPGAEAIWVNAILEGTDGRCHELILVLDPGTSETILERRIAEKVGLDESRNLGPARYRADPRSRLIQEAAWRADLPM